MHIDELANDFGIKFEVVRTSRKGNLVMECGGSSVRDLGHGRAYYIIYAWAIVRPGTQEVLSYHVEEESYDY